MPSDASGDRVDLDDMSACAVIDRAGQALLDQDVRHAIDAKRRLAERPAAVIADASRSARPGGTAAASCAQSIPRGIRCAYTVRSYRVSSIEHIGSSRRQRVDVTPDGCPPQTTASSEPPDVPTMPSTRTIGLVPSRPMTASVRSRGRTTATAQTGPPRTVARPRRATGSSANVFSVVPRESDSTHQQPIVVDEGRHRLP